MKRMLRRQNTVIDVDNSHQQQQSSVPQNTYVEEVIAPLFCTGCSCTDDCANNDLCECRKLTVEAHNRLSESLQIHKSQTIGYNFKLLDDKIISGIYEVSETFNCNPGNKIFYVI